MVSVLSITFLGSYLYFSKSETKICTGDVGKLNVGVYRGDVSLLFYVAVGQNFFVENGLDVSFKEFTAGGYSVNSLIADEVDIATAGETVFSKSIFTESDLMTFGSIANFQIVEMVARLDKGIEKPSDLVGKKIGLTKGTGGEFIVSTFLEKNGANLDDVEIIDFAPTELLNAIVEEKVDAVISWDPIVYNIVNQLGDKVISWPAQSTKDIYFLLITKNDFI